MGLLSSRPRALTHLSLGRGRYHGHFRPPPVGVFCIGDVERAGSDTQGTPVWLDGQRRKSRRRCQRVLLLSRLDAYTFLHEGALQVSAARISVPPTCRRKSPPWAE